MESGLSQVVDFEDYRDQSISYSPMKLFAFGQGVVEVGFFRDFRALDELNCSLTFQTEALSSDQGALIDLYQEREEGRLERVFRAFISCNGGLAHFEVPVITIHQPLLVVVKSVDHEILATDIVPLPSLFLPSNMMLVELHSAFASKLSFFQAAAQISHGYLTSISRREASAAQVKGFPNRKETAVVLFSRRAQDAIPEVDFRTAGIYFDQIFLLEQGVVVSESGDAVNLSELLEDIRFTHIAFLDRSASIATGFLGVFCA